MAGKRTVSRIPAPKKWWEKLLRRPYLFDLLLAFGAIFGIAASAIRSFAGPNQSDQLAGALFVLGGLMAGLFASGKFVLLWATEDAREAPHDFDSVLLTLHTIIRSRLPEPERQRIRLRFAIHRPEGEHLVQVTEYIGGDRDAKVIGRRIGKHKGIIGLAIKEQKAIAASRASEDYREYVDDLEKTWGFTKDEARTRDPAAMSWVAVPIIADSRVEGVLYGDSTTRDFFGSETLQLVSEVTAALAILLEERY